MKFPLQCKYPIIEDIEDELCATLHTSEHELWETVSTLEQELCDIIHISEHDLCHCVTLHTSEHERCDTIHTSETKFVIHFRARTL